MSYEKKTLVDQASLEKYTEELIKGLKRLFIGYMEVDSSLINVTKPSKVGIFGIDENTNDVFMSTGTSLGDWVNILDMNFGPGDGGYVDVDAISEREVDIIFDEVIDILDENDV